MEKKYELIPSDKKRLYRIKALKALPDVKIGDVGGYVEREYNLSHHGNCWIYGNAIVRDYAIVYDNASIYGNALIYGDARVYDNATVLDNAEIYGKATVCNKASIYGNAEIYGNVVIGGDVKVYGNAKIYDNATVYGNASICGNVEIRSNVEIRGNAMVLSEQDYIIFKNWWSSGRFFTWTRSNDKWKVGCFYGTGKELIEKAYKDSEISGREYERIVRYVEDIKNNKERQGKTAIEVIKAMEN